MKIPRIEIWDGNVVRKYHKHQNKDGSFTLELNEKYEYYKKKGKAFMGFEDANMQVKDVDPLIVPDERIESVEKDRALFSGLTDRTTSLIDKIKAKREEDKDEG